MHHLIRLRRGRKIYYLLASLALVSTACNTSLTNPPIPEAEQVATVSITAGDTAAAIERRYGGEVAVWEPGAYAVLSLNSGLSSQALTAPTVIVEPNKDVFLAGGEVATMNGRTRIWAGGTSNVWAGGRTRIWAGGMGGLWQYGTFTWMPENTPLWKQVGLEQGHSLAPNLGYGVKVAVIDTGVDVYHPALSAALAPASEWRDFYGGDTLPQEEQGMGSDGYGHGTNVAGIIRQVAPNAIILPLRVLGPDGMGDVDKLAQAIQYATAAGARVINLSLGSDIKITAVENAIKAATDKGVLVVASSGNTGDTRVSWPASSAADKPNARRLSVTSVDAFDRKSSFSAYGKSVEVAAPGENVFGPAPNLQVAAWSGTSMAAPMASGALALALGQELKVPAGNLAGELMVRAADIYNNGLNASYKDGVGKGRLNLAEFLRNVAY